MMRFLNKLFDIKTNEWSSLAPLFLIFVLTNAGAIWGISIVSGAFLKQIGYELLPWVFVLGAIFSIAGIAVYTIFVDRISNDKLLNLIFLAEVAGITLGLILLWLGYRKIAYPFLYLVILAWLAVINTHLITYVNSFFDIQTAKRALPVVSAGDRLGAIVAGLTLPLLNGFFGLSPAGIIVIWLLTHLVVMVLVWLMPYLQKWQTTSDARSEPVSPFTPPTSTRQRPSYLENIREGFRYTTQSPYLRWMAIGTLVLMVLMPVLEYRASELLCNVYGCQTISAEGDTVDNITTTDSPESEEGTDEIANFIANLRGIGNVIVLPMLLFGMGRIIAWFGLGNASLIFPVTNLIVCSSLILTAGEDREGVMLAMAAIALLNRNSFRLSFLVPVEGLLYNAVPLRVKGRVRAFVSGLLTPIGSLIGGLILLLPVVKGTPSLVLILIGVLGGAYVGSALVIRRLYSRALIKLLEQEDFSFLLSQQASDVMVADPTTLKFLEQKLVESDESEFTIFMAKLISQIGGSEAAPILVRAVEGAGDTALRVALVDVMVAADMRGQTVRQLYSQLLDDPDGGVRQSALSGLEQLDGAGSKSFRELTLKTIDDPDIEVRLQFISALIRGNTFYQTEPAVQALDQILAAEDPPLQARAIHVMGQMANARTLQKLLPYLTHPSDEVRLETIIALEAMPDDVVLPQEDSLGLVEQMSRLLKDPVERIRQAALVILGRTNKREAYRAMVNALTDSSPLVRTTSADVLVRAGRAVIPLVHPCLDSPDPDLRKMAAVILSRVNRHEFGPLISSQITGNLLTIYSNYGYLNVLSAYQGYTSIVVLQNTLYEQNQHLLDEIFYLLTALHNPESIAVIAESFRNSSSRTRANALEAFETLTTPQMAKLVGPLFDPEAEPDYLLRLSRETWEMVHPDATDVVTKLTFNTPDTWLRAIMIFGLGEIGATIWGRESPPTSPKPSPAKSRPAPPTGLLDVLESLEDNKTTSTGKKRPRRSAHLLDTLADTDDTEAGGVKSRRSRRKRAVDPLAALTDETEGAGPTPEAASPSEPEDKQTDIPLPFKTRTELEAVIKENITASETEIRMAARSAQRMLAGVQIVQARLEAHAASRLIGASPDNGQIDEEEFMLSTIEKVIFLKKVPFFQSMTIDQLKAIATVCEEELFEEDTVIFEQDDLGGTLYVIVSGKVGIEHEGTRKGSVVRVATLGAHSYFGEMTLFDNSPRTASAIALQDTLTLRLRHEPVVALARQHPGLSLELIKVLSQRLRESNNQIASLTRSKPRALQKLYDSLE